MLRSLFTLTLMIFFLGVSCVEAKTFTGRVTKISGNNTQISIVSTIEKSEQTFDISDRNFKVTVN